MKRFDLRTNENLKIYFNEYFGRSFTGDLWFAPDYCCNTFARTLYGWVKQQPWKIFSFKIPMTWREPPFHDADTCYFCMTNRKVHHSKIEYQFSDYTVPPLPRAEYENPPVYKGNASGEDNLGEMNFDRNPSDVIETEGFDFDEPYGLELDASQLPSGQSTRRNTKSSVATNTYPPPKPPPKKPHFLTAQDINDMGKNAE